MAGHTWFITGISRGLGFCLAQALLQRGDRVAGTVRKAADLQPLKATFGDRLWFAELDVSQADAIQEVVDRAFTEHERIDVVINNAGYSLAGAVEECSLEMIRHQLDTNLLGSILVIKAALPHLRQQGNGRILQVSSGAGQLGFAGLALYAASKWGIEGFIESLRPEVAPFGIEATLFEPGAIRTDFGSRGQMPPAIAAYMQSPAHYMRQAVESLRGGSELAPVAGGDPAKMAQVMIESLNQAPAPARIVMGSDIYDRLLGAYHERASALEAQKSLAYATDF